MKVVAIDFDDTIAEAVEPYDGSIGKMFEDANYYINKLYYEDYYIIIWTCRAGEGLVEAKNWLDRKEIMYNKINENAPWEMLGYKPLPKIFAHCYIDDRNLGGLPSDVNGDPDWSEIYARVKGGV